MEKTTMAWVSAAAVLGLVAMAASAGTADASGGRFVREIGALGGNNEFRVNSPDTTTGPFADRPEAKKDGVLRINVDQDLREVESAELCLELWGGHPGVANKRFMLNGQSEYSLPEVGSADDNCTYSYPLIALKLGELCQGENDFAFTCDKGTTFWGHFLIRKAILRLYLKPGCKTLAEAGLAEAALAVAASEPVGPERAVALDLQAAPNLRSRVASAEYWGLYNGFDENGNGEAYDWHGFTKDGRAVGNVATVAANEGLGASWPLAMVPTDRPVLVRARVRFADAAGLVYETPVIQVLAAEDPSPVRTYLPRSLPRPFWSRASGFKACVIPLDVSPGRIEAAQLHVAIWDGGAGDVSEPFTLNGRPLPVAGKGDHEVLYSVVNLEPDLLRKGDNVIVVDSDTEHHGIEVLLPGPALVVRLAPTKKDSGAGH